MDLSGLLVKVAGGHPWIAVEGWRLTVVAGLVLCAWGVARAVRRSWHQPGRSGGRRRVESSGARRLRRRYPQRRRHDQPRRGGRRSRPHETTVVGVVPGRTGGDGEGSSSARRPGLAWWCWKGSWRRRGAYLVGGFALTLGALLAAGLASGGDGFSWLRSASQATVASSFSLLNLAGTTSSSLANAIQLGGIAVGRCHCPLAPAASQLGRRSGAGLRRHGDLRDQSAALVCPVGAPTTGLHGLRCPAPPRRNPRPVRDGGLERVAIWQPRLVRRDRRR